MFDVSIMHPLFMSTKVTLGAGRDSLNALITVKMQEFSLHHYINSYETGKDYMYIVISWWVEPLEAYGSCVYVCVCVCVCTYMCVTPFR